MKAIVSKYILTTTGIRPGAIIIKDGIIKDVCYSLPSSFEGEVDDVDDLVVMPGMIDPHVHINEPGRTDWEGFVSATQAAAMGGITTIVDMPLNSSPVTTTMAAFQEKLEATTDKLFVHCGFWGGVTANSLHDLPELLPSGVLGIKCFLIDSGISEFLPASMEDLRKAMPLIAKKNLPLLVHAELDDSKRNNIGSSYSNFLASRPKSWENKAIEEIIALAKEYCCRVHIVHLSSAEAIPMLQKAKTETNLITVETCPHYIVMAAEDIPDGKPIYKCCPPIRERENNDLLWQAVKDKTIDFIASDHSPAPPEIKRLQSGDLEKAWGGIASLQFTLPLLWTKGKKDGYTLDDIAEMTERTAKFIGYGREKGTIAPGKDADLIAWNPEETFTITEEMIYHRHKCTPYLNWELSGKVYHTYLRGEKIVANGKLDEKPQGKLLLRM